MRPLTPAEQEIADFYQTPLGQEIMEANRNAVLEKQAAILQVQMDEIVNKLPLPLRLIMRAIRDS
mgnify:FL=1